MKRILALALAIFSVGTLPQVVQPANAQLTIQLGGDRERYPVYRERYPIYVNPLPRRTFNLKRRIIRQRQLGVPSRWEDRRERNQYRRIWVPGYYR